MNQVPRSERRGILLAESDPVACASLARACRRASTLVHVVMSRRALELELERLDELQLIPELVLLGSPFVHGRDVALVKAWFPATRVLSVPRSLSLLARFATAQAREDGAAELPCVQSGLVRRCLSI